MEVPIDFRPKCPRCNTPCIVSHIANPAWRKFPSKHDVEERWGLRCTICGYFTTVTEDPMHGRPG